MSQVGVQPADVSAVWKERYIRPTVEFLGYEGNAAYATMKKMENLGGYDQRLPVIVSPPQGESGQIGSAIKNQTAGNQQPFLIVPVERFGVVTIDGQTQARSEGDKNAFINAKTLEMDGIIRQLGRSTNIHLFRDGSGVIGCVDPTLNANVAVSTIILGTTPVAGVANALVNGSSTTMCSIYDAVNFEQGMAINLVYWTGAAWAYRNPTGSTAAVAYVIYADTGAGTITVGASWSSSVPNVAAPLNQMIPGAVLGDCIVRDGDASIGGQGPGGANVISGFLAWNPWQAPSVNTDSFFSVNRGTFANRLAGQRLVMPGSDITSIIMAGCALANNQSARIDTVWMNYRNYNLFLQQLEAKRTYDQDVEVGARGAEGEVAGISFMGIRINIPGSKANVMMDNCCPDQAIFFQESDDWEFQSAGPFPRDLFPGLPGGLPLDNANATQFRRGGYPQLACYNPAHQLVAIAH